MKRKSSSLLSVPKKQKIDDPLFVLFQSFTHFIDVDSLLVFDHLYYGFEPVHKYGFIFSKLAQTCRTARKIFRPYTILLKQVSLKFELCLECIRRMVFDYPDTGILYLQTYKYTPLSTEYNFRKLSLVNQRGKKPFQVYEHIRNIKGAIVGSLPTNY
jgi:hypothetical protein